MSAPVTPSFGAIVRIRCVRAFLACSGPLMARAVVRILSESGKLLAESLPAPLSSTPEWNDAMDIVFAPRDSEALRIEVVDGITGQFLGQATPVTFGPQLAARSNGPVQLMLTPRLVNGEPVAADRAALGRYMVDDFGYLVIEYEARRLPAGPAYLQPPTAAERASPAQPAAAAYPLGCTMRVQWLASNATRNASRHTVSATFGRTGDFTVGSGTPLHVSIASADDTRVRLAFWAGDDSSINDVGEVCFTLPVHKRDVGFDVAVPIAGVGSMQGVDVGIAVLSFVVTSSPYTGERNAPATDFGRAAPDTPPGLFHNVTWESEDHIARATERRWRSSVVVEAAPQPDHVRHLLDVVAGRTELHAALLPLVCAYFNLPPNSTEPATCDLRQLLIAMAFACHGIDAHAAALFVFEAVAQQGVAGTDQIAFLLEHSLLPKSLDLPASEIRRRAADLVAAHDDARAGSSSGFNVAAFDAVVARNWALWHLFGVAVEGAVTPSRASAVAAAASTSDTAWRHFIVRVPGTKKAFAVTAHKDDTFQRVAKQIEGSVGIGHAKQRMAHDNALVDLTTAVGTVIRHSTQPVQEVCVSELDETVALTLVYRAKDRKWEYKVNVHDKVLRLRAHVQQKTMIPLSRIQLTLGGSPMWDRHAIDHYSVFDGVVIDVAAV